MSSLFSITTRSRLPPSVSPSLCPHEIRFYNLNSGPPSPLTHPDFDGLSPFLFQRDWFAYKGGSPPNPLHRNRYSCPFSSFKMVWDRLPNSRESLYSPFCMRLFPLRSWSRPPPFPRYVKNRRFLVLLSRTLDAPPPISFFLSFVR